MYGKLLSRHLCDLHKQVACSLYRNSLLTDEIAEIQPQRIPLGRLIIILRQWIYMPENMFRGQTRMTGLRLVNLLLVTYDLMTLQSLRLTLLLGRRTMLIPVFSKPPNRQRETGRDEAGLDQVG